MQDGIEIDSKSGLAQFIVHPPTGKWLIASGIKLFGYNEFGWRFAAAVVGSISIVLMYFTAKKLFNNRLLSVLAASLISMDGLHLVHSRIALLDIFLLFFIQIAVLAFLHNRYWLSALALGLACSVKWSGLYVLIALALYVLVLDIRRNRYLGVQFPIREMIRKSLLYRFLQFGIFPVFIYIASWFSWFASDKGWDRNYSSKPLISLWHYHSEILNFHTKLTDAHPYSANPWSWLIQGRPTSFFYETPKSCGGTSCSQEILALGTPILWWAGIFAIALTFGFFVTNRDRISMIILAGIAGTYLPWFLIQSRTTFYFYAISILPFLILALIYSFNWALKYGDYRKQIIGFLVVVALNFIYFLPILLGIEIPYSQWLSRMWLKSWI